MKPKLAQSSVLFVHTNEAECLSEKQSLLNPIGQNNAVMPPPYPVISCIPYVVCCMLKLFVFKFVIV